MLSIEDFNQKKFLKEVRAFMKKNGITVRAFAKMADISFPTLYRLEKTKSAITLSTIKKLQKAMDSYVPDVI
jgi:predicted transcriptional regulator